MITQHTMHTDLENGLYKNLEEASLMNPMRPLTKATGIFYS